MTTVRSVRVSFTVSSAEKRLLLRRARRAGMTLSAYLRHRVLNDVRDTMLPVLAMEVLAFAKEICVTSGRGPVSIYDHDATLAAREQQARKEVRDSMSSDELQELRDWLVKALGQTESHNAT